MTRKLGDLPTALFLHASDELYGADRQLLWLALTARDVVRPIVVLPDDLPYEGTLSQRFTAEGIEVIRGPVPVLRRRYMRPGALPAWLLRSARGLRWTHRVARDRRASVIVTNTSSVMVGPVIARLLHVRHVWFLREIVERPVWFRPLTRATARLARGTVICVSNAVARWLGPVPDRGPVVLRDAVDASATPAPLVQRPTAAFVGRLNRWKGWEAYLRAAAEVHARIPESRFVIAGGPVPGDEATVASVAEAVSAADPTGDWLTWNGEVPDGRTVMRASWVVVVPSTQPDPLPNVVLEAMAEGRAVVASCLGGIPEMVVDGQTGLLVDPRDEEALAAAIQRLLADRSLTEQMGRASLERARAAFSLGGATARWRSLLEGTFP